MSLEASVATLSELIGVTNALLEKALNAMITSVSNAVGTAAPIADETKVDQPAPAEPAKTRGRGRPPAAKPADAAPAAAATAAPAIPGKPETTFKDVEAAIVSLAKVKGRSKAEAVLGNLGVVKCGDLKATDYDKAIDAFNAARNAA